MALVYLNEWSISPLFSVHSPSPTPPPSNEEHVAVWLNFHCDRYPQITWPPLFSSNTQANFSLIYLLMTQPIKNPLVFNKKAKISYKTLFWHLQLYRYKLSLCLLFSNRKGRMNMSGIYGKVIRGEGKGPEMHFLQVETKCYI